MFRVNVPAKISTISKHFVTVRTLFPWHVVFYRFNYKIFKSFRYFRFSSTSFLLHITPAHIGVYINWITKSGTWLRLNFSHARANCRNLTGYYFCVSRRSLQHSNIVPTVIWTIFLVYCIIFQTGKFCKVAVSRFCRCFFEPVELLLPYIWFKIVSVYSNIIVIFRKFYIENNITDLVYYYPMPCDFSFLSGHISSLISPD